MLAVRRSPLAFSSLFDIPAALSMVRALDESPAALRSGAVSESDDSYTVTVNVPGLTREALTLKVTDNTLTLEGARRLSVPEGFKAVHQERGNYRVSRKLRFSKGIDAEGVTATLTDGVLTVTLPKAASARVCQITIG